MEKDNISLSDIYCVIVLYNKAIKDSVTFNCLKNIKDINIIVCDNSTKNFGNGEYIKDFNFIYLDMHGNKGLSRAYNTVIDFLKEKSGIICLFDDDTSVTFGYFESLLKEVIKSDASIFLPIVYDKIGILSPCKINNLRVERIKDLKELNASNITGINSGMAINLDIFKDYRYNEKYFLDYIDHDFLRSMKVRNKKIQLLNTELNQDFSRNNNSSLDSSLYRFKIFKKDFKCFYNSSLKSRIFSNLSVLKIAIGFTIKFKTLKFLIEG